MLAKEVAELLLENPEADVSYAREKLYNGSVKTSIFIYEDLLASGDKYDNHCIEFTPKN